MEPAHRRSASCPASTSKGVVKLGLGPKSACSHAWGNALHGKQLPHASRCSAGPRTVTSRSGTTKGHSSRNSALDTEFGSRIVLQWKGPWSWRSDRLSLGPAVRHPPSNLPSGSLRASSRFPPQGVEGGVNEGTTEKDPSAQAGSQK